MFMMVCRKVSSSNCHHCILIVVSAAFSKHNNKPQEGKHSIATPRNHLRHSLHSSKILYNQLLEIQNKSIDGVCSKCSVCVHTHVHVLCVCACVCVCVHNMHYYVNCACCTNSLMYKWSTIVAFIVSASVRWWSEYKLQ